METRARTGTTKESVFWAKVTKGDGCWLYTGLLSRTGYGIVRIRGRHSGAHRLSYEMAKGPIPAGMCVCHTCDVRNCVNPDHLWIGTQRDNMADMWGKGRGKTGQLRRGPGRTFPFREQRGEANCLAKLTEDNVRTIRRRYAAGGVSQRMLAREYGVDQGAIAQLLRFKTWTHVPAEVAA